MSLTPKPIPEREETPSVSAGSPRWLTVVLLVVGLLLVYLIYAQYSTRSDLAARLQQADGKLTKLESRAATLEDNYANLKAQFDVTGERLGLTREELARARAAAQQIKEEQRRTTEQLGTELEQAQSQLGSLSGEVTGVKGDVAATREELQKTKTALERTIGDLGVQSGLIARNRDEVEELKRRGERDYFEFNIKKSKQYTRVGTVSVRLNKSDSKRQKFTLTVLANDKLIEKKDKTLLEPVQFYLQGTRHLLELVVYEVKKDGVTGYLSVPKEVALRQ